jgi:hypothetical protein
VIAQQNLPVRVERWLEVNRLQGPVQFESKAGRRAARQGDRLSKVGDGLSTGSQASASVLLDTGIGVLEVAPNTQFKITTLEVNPDQSRITRLRVTSGRVKLKVRKFTNPNSELEIQTPAGVSGVRGTEFGVVVQPNGKTGLAVLEGGVKSSAQGQSVLVPEQFQNLTLVGEPPQPATPLRDDPGLTFQWERQVRRQLRFIRLVGQVDPINEVQVNDRPIDTGRDGKFSLEFPMRSRVKVKVQVSTPLGTIKDYELAAP